MSASYLIRRNGHYHFRIKVPVQLREAVGRTEIHRSLHTSNSREARKLASIMRSNIETEFAYLHTQNLIGSSIISGTNESAIRPSSSRITPIDKRPRGQSLETRRRMLSDLIDEFTSERASSWTSKTHLMHVTSLRHFLSYVGDKPVDAINRQDCRGFRNTMAKLPRNFSSKYKGKPLQKIANLGCEPMHPNTTNRILSAVSGFFSWAETEGFVASHPARRLRLPVNDRADTQRSVFTEDQLSLLFRTSPIYEPTDRDSSDVRGTFAFSNARYWIPLIALYSGMRLEEIAQLHAVDIKKEAGVWVFDVNGAGARRLKTPGSTRLVPIHSTLRNLGLLAYWKHITDAGEERLWPTLSRSNQESYSVQFSKCFSRYKRTVGIEDTKVSFHSFRHTFINHLKQLDVNENKIRELVGHTNNSITMSRYGKRYTPAKLSEVIETVDFELNISPRPANAAMMRYLQA